MRTKTLAGRNITVRTKTPATWSALVLGTTLLMAVPLALPGHADGAVSGMEMGGTKTPHAPTAGPFSVTATLNPAVPTAGDNALDLLLRDAAGKQVTGLKLTGSVAMTSMDMGTTHPAFAEAGSGHYQATVTFSMNGPWRVIIRGQGVKIAALDFEPGSKTPWKSPQIKYTPQIKAAGPSSPAAAAKAPAADAMAGMDMTVPAGPDKAAKTGGASDKNTDKNTMPGADVMPGMDMGGTGKPGDISGMKTGIADIKTAAVPELQEKGTYTATGTEDWKMQTGFGHNAGMVGMMNQMMIGGSGMEGMKMAPMNMKFDEQNYAKPEGDDGAGGMAGMDIGGTAPKANGKNGAKAAGESAMPGMDMGGTTTNAPSPSAPASSRNAPGALPSITAIISSPKPGDNAMRIVVADAKGQPVTGAKITTSAAMTSMDMGTTHPAVMEVGNGTYKTTASFSMAGPWRVKVSVTMPGLKPVTKAFDFTAK